MKLSRPWGRSAWVAPSAWMPQTQGSGYLLVHHYSTDVLFVKWSLLLTRGVCDGAQGERDQENERCAEEKARIPKASRRIGERHWRFSARVLRANRQQSIIASSSRT